MGTTRKRLIIFPVIFVFIWLAFIWPFWLKRLVPAPLDFLVSFYAPWQSQYPIPAKNPAISDVVNQIIPWKTFTISEWQSGRVPLWNSYNFSGTPHAANWQSAVFYPANIFPLLINFIDGWSLYILIQPLLAGLFTYLFCRSLKLSSISSLVSAISFSFSGFMTSWLEWGTLGHALLWLPASLWSIEKYLSSKKPLFLILNSLFLSLSLLAGHLQISLYVLMFSLAYFAYRSHKFLSLLFLYSLPLLLVSFQLLPSIELYLNSLRSQAIDVGWFNYFRIPVEYLATFIAPDFFGNPTTRNEWGKGSYVEMMGYIGLIPLMLAFSSLELKKAKFFVGVVIISLLFSLKTPVANILTWLKLPVFATSSPARIISLISFSLAILAGIGLDYAIKNKFKSLKWPTIVTGSVLVILWSAALFLKIPVAQRNLIIPSLIFIIFIIFINIINIGKLKSWLIISCWLLVAVTAADLFRFHHKFTPYTSREYWYPKLPVIEKLQQIQGVDRSFGLFDANLNLPFRINSIEGYDSLFYASYARITRVKEANRISGVTIERNTPQTMQVLSGLGVKYVVQPTVHGAAPWELRLWEYPNQFELIYEDSNYQIFNNKLAQPVKPFSMTSQKFWFTIGLIVSICSLIPFFSLTTFTRVIK